MAKDTFNLLITQKKDLAEGLNVVFKQFHLADRLGLGLAFLLVKAIPMKNLANKYPISPLPPRIDDISA